MEMAKERIDVFPIDWVANDSELSQFRIRLFGKTLTGRPVMTDINFPPYFFVGVPQTWSEAKIKYFVSTCIAKYGAIPGQTMQVKRKTLHGFTNNEERTFVQVAFSSYSNFKRARFAISREERLQTYEASLDPLLRFFHARKIDPSGWVSIPDKPLVDFRDVYPSPDIPTSSRPPLVIASWDIEAVSGSGKFPNADNPDDKLITIGTTFQRYGEAEPYHRHVVTLDTCESVEGVEVVACETEADVIQTWLETLKAHNVDIMVGYNVFQFDFRYIYGRSLLCVDEFGEQQVDLSKLGLNGGEVVEKNLSSAAYGDNKFFMLTSPGILQIDLLQIFRRDLKLDSYSLNNVSKKYLEGFSKLDLLPGEIFEKFKGTAADRATIAEYCVRDTELPLKLMDKLHTLPNLFEMSNATCVPVEFLSTRGQQIKVYSMLTRKARSLGFVAPDMEKAQGPSDKYEGATVLEAKKGGYFDVISALDFASLYPSIMRAHNICPSTLVLDDERYGHVEGVNYYTIGEHKFATGVQSVVPNLLEELARFRKQAKKDMAAAKERGDTFSEALYNAKQLAFKVSMNSVYGFFGATRGMFPCVPVAAAVTATGRAMIEFSKKMAEKLVPGTEVVYGDSVLPGTPILVRGIDGKIDIRTIESLSSSWVPYEGFKMLEHGLTEKEQATPESLFAWTHQGWAPIKRVIRHKCNKKIYRVLTHTGLVDVTEDHSLLTAKVEQIKPKDATVGMDLLHGLPDLNSSHCYGGNCKIVPREVLEGSREVKEAFLKGSWDSDGCRRIDTKNQLTAQSYYLLLRSMGFNVSINDRKDKSDSFRITWTEGKQRRNPTAIKKIYVLHASYDGYVYDIETEAGVFQAGIGGIIVKNTDSIMCKFKIPGGTMKDHFETAERVANEITKSFLPPIELEFEKTYQPYLLFSKKRYAGLMYTNPESPDKIDVKGLQLVRRDSAPIVREVSQDILNAIMHSGSTELAVERTRGHIKQLLDGKVPLEKFIVSKQLRANYANENSQPHVVVAKKLLARRGYPVTQGERVPYVFIEDKEKMDGLISARAEDPSYVKDHGLAIDTLYYLKNQLMSPITALLEVLVDNVEDEVLGHPDIQSKLQKLEAERKSDIKTSKRIKLNTSRRQHEITKFFAFGKD